MFKTIKKVWRYIAKYKKLLTISITAMLIVQMLGLVSPLIVKAILDDQLVGISKPWYQVSENAADTVAYQGNYYTQTLENDQPISILIYEGRYYFIEDLVIEGQKTLVGDTLTITDIQGNQFTYTVTLLSQSEVSAFYHPFVD